MKIFKYCDNCARDLKLPELSARRKDSCDNCDATNVPCSYGDAKDKPKATPKAKAKPKSKAKPKAKAKAKPKAAKKGKKK